MHETITTVAGIDIGKWELVVSVGGDAPFTVGNDAAGRAQLVERLVAAGVRLVGLEATGGYEREVLTALQGAGLEAVRHQAYQVKLFARLQLRHAKNDRLDAQLIAAFTAMNLLFGRGAPPIIYGLEALNDRLVYIEQLGEDIVRLKTRLEQQHDPRLRTQIVSDIDSLSQRQRAERRLLEKSVRADSGLERRLDLLLSIPGIGLPTALALVIAMPELGAISREKAAALIGLAPFDHDSGQHEGPRHIRAGRARPRKALYAAALPAAFKWNPALKSLYQRLIARSKSHKQALVACARKLVVYANTVLARNTPWIPTN